MKAPLALLAACLLLGARAALGGGCPFTAGTLGQQPVNAIDEFPADGSGWKMPKMTKPSSCSAEEYETIARELVALAEDVANLPKLMRLGFHACGTWSAAGRTGGCSGGWHQWAQDYKNGANAGLEDLTLAVKDLKANHSCITFSDLVTLGGAVATEAAGGPPIAWYPGRKDAKSHGPAYPAFSSRLPMGGFSPSGVFYYYINLGLTNREAVALTGGGHSIGGADVDATGWNGTFTSAGDVWPKPSNAYFKTLVELGWEYEVVNGTGRVQYVPIKGQNTSYTAEDGTQVFRLPSDIALRGASVFSFWSVAYAQNETAFLSDFQRVMQRVMQLGAGETWEPDTSYVWKGLKGDWEGFGPDIKPQSDYSDIPLPGITLEDLMEFNDQIEEPLADPSTALTLDEILGSLQKQRK
ncbi:cytochrome C peroxidase [Chlorella sorokiniana]|uniref:Cytochrome C peroxidase n=1 Tax=Chlorella sorokiniana TaxID=3076 RepID=A0A2P6TKI0_CHLSO|nr:cytochrome C peroxidase [Chlorella sorokiniana]|eukprot:PRW44589.1 cytochrome C peroxidase [Chlorella sorokiniana]